MNEAMQRMYAYFDGELSKQQEQAFLDDLKNDSRQQELFERIKAIRAAGALPHKEAAPPAFHTRWQESVRSRRPKKAGGLKIVLPIAAAAVAGVFVVGFAASGGFGAFGSAPAAAEYAVYSSADEFGVEYSQEIESVAGSARIGEASPQQEAAQAAPAADAPQQEAESAAMPHTNAAADANATIYTLSQREQLVRALDEALIPYCSDETTMVIPSDGNVETLTQIFGLIGIEEQPIGEVTLHFESE